MNLDQLAQRFDPSKIENEFVKADQRLASLGYIEFIKIAWDLVEPSRPFVRTWHVDAICDHLQAVADGDLRRLVINVPPNTSKSMICSVFFVPWLWTRNPEKKLIYACYDDKLARRDSLRAKELIRSKWYQARWGDRFEIAKNLQDTGEIYRTTKGGFRMITTIGGSVTGEHADIQIVDDPIKPKESTGVQAVNQTYLKVVNDWWKDTMSTRLVDYDKSARVIIMQRLHEADLAGTVLEDDEQEYEHLCLPMEYEPETKCCTSIGFEDPRTEPNELLCPERFSRAAVETLKKELGPRGTQAQLQQNPVSLKGDIFKRNKVRFYKQLPRKFDVTCQSWDCTFKEKGTSFVAGHVWGRVGPDYYFIDRLRDRWGFSDTCKQIVILTLRHPNIRKKLIEAKANGDAIVDHLKKEVSGLELVEPLGGKVARANAIEPLWDSGNIWFPHPDICEWSESVLDFFVKFPMGKFDDDIDAASQAITHLEKSQLFKLQAAMQGAMKIR